MILTVSLPLKPQRVLKANVLGNFDACIRDVFQLGREESFPTCEFGELREHSRVAVPIGVVVDSDAVDNDAGSLS